MNRAPRLSSILRLIILLVLVACQTSTTPSPTVTLSPTETIVPTVTLRPTATLVLSATPVPTETPVPKATPVPTAIPPLCDIAAAALTTAASAPSVLPTSDTSKVYAKYEPPDGQAYFGFLFKLWDESPASENAKWGDVRPFEERICDSLKFELDGKIPTILKVQNGWKSSDGRLQPFSGILGDIEKIHAALGPTVVPMLEWQSGDDNTVTTKDIASGQYDDYVTQFARDVKQYGQPLFIRLICGEFNGNWWQWCSPKANPNLTTRDFVDAWRRVVDIFRQEGVTNVAWIWTPVAPLPPSLDYGWDPNWQSYYPGDDYVDWVGADLNDWGKPNWLDPVVKFGIAHSKPFFLAEFAIRNENTGLTHQQQINWLSTMFDYFESHPQIKAMLYQNYKCNPDTNLDSANHVFLYDGKVNYVPNVNDLDQRLIAGGADMQALFASRIANSRYVSMLVNTP